MAKFTPGPWKMIMNGNESDKDQVCSFYGNEDEYVADVYRGYVGSIGINYDQFIANANLIAAAPDMYEALKAVFDNGIGCGFCMLCDDIPGPDCPLAMVKAALAKARGEK